MLKLPQQAILKKGVLDQQTSIPFKYFNFHLYKKNTLILSVLMGPKVQQIPLSFSLIPWRLKTDLFYSPRLGGEIISDKITVRKSRNVFPGIYWISPTEWGILLTPVNVFKDYLSNKIIKYRWSTKKFKKGQHQKNLNFIVKL